MNGSSTKCRACATRLSKTKPYSGDSIKAIYKGMKQRCYNKNSSSYERYGGKGITICDDWLNDPNEFYEWAYANGYKDGLTIERTDFTKGYSPENCTFITLAEQSRNRSSCIFVTINGERKCLSEWCRYYGINVNTVRARHFQKGMDWQAALTLPVDKSRSLR